MDVRAIILVGAEEAPEAPLHAFGHTPPALLEVLGAPLVYRIVERLRRSGVSDVAVLVDDGAAAARAMKRVPAAARWTLVSPGQIWRAAESAFSDLVQAGAELVVLIRLGPYAELDYDALLQSHMDQHSRVTAVYLPGGQSLDTFVINASRRNDAAYLLRHRLNGFRARAANFVFHGYLNRLRQPGDLRCLAVDGLLMRNQIAPLGLQIRPGIWVANRARIQSGARVLAPAFVGERVKVRSAAVITRCTALEHHSEVDCGTVVEDSTVLPFSYVGAGLDLAHAVVGHKRLAHLRRNIEVEIADAKLVGMASPHAPLRALVSAASLAGFLPAQMWRGLFGAQSSEATLPAAVQSPSTKVKSPAATPASSSDSAEFSADFVVARRYGNE